MPVYPCDNPVSSFFGISSNCLDWNGQSFESHKHGISPFTPRWPSLDASVFFHKGLKVPSPNFRTSTNLGSWIKPSVNPSDACFVTTNDHSMENTHILASFAKRVSLDPVHPLSIGCKQVAEYVSRLFDWSQSVWQPSAASPGDGASVQIDRNQI